MGFEAACYAHPWSHYSRKDTERKYFAADLSTRKLYDLYKEKQEESGSWTAAYTTFQKIFGNEFNIGFHHPKKDQCATCARLNVELENQELSEEEKLKLEEEKEEHLCKKNSAQEHKKQAIEDAKESTNTIVVTFDLQSVLQLPSSEVSQLYYKRKLCIYNLTVYECSSPKNDAFCFLWSEIDGKRGSCEIGTCVLRYIAQLPVSVKHLVLFSDSCGGQNRNQFVAAGLLWAAQKTNLDTLELCFLEPGHTQMECDAMHSAIEHEKRYKKLYTLNDWRNVMISARCKHPYKVVELHYSDFYDLKSLCQDLIKNRKFDTHGAVVNWLHIKVLKFEKGNAVSIFYKTDHSQQDWHEIKVKPGQTGRPLVFQAQLPSRYRNKLPVSAAKKKDLVDLCKTGVIPVEYHAWYKHLNSSVHVRDTVDGQSDSDNDSDE